MFGYKISNKYLGLFILWMCLTSAAPFILYSWPGHPHKFGIFFCLLSMIIHMVGTGIAKLDKGVSIVSFIMIIAYALRLVFLFDLSYLSLIIQLLSYILVASYIKYIVTFDLFIKSFIYSIIVMGVGGTIILVCHIAFGVEPLFSVNYSGNTHSYFLYLTTTNSYVNFGDLRIIRFSGFFDESGCFSLCSLFALLLNKIYLKNNVVEKLLIIFTLPSLAMSYIISLVVYFCFFKLNRKNIIGFSFFIICILGIAFLITEYKDESEISKRVYELTVERFQYSTEDGLSGNSRKTETALDKQLFLDSPLFGNGYSQIHGANIYSPLAAEGVLGFFIVYLPLFYVFFKSCKCKNKLLVVKCFALIAINLLHRPLISDMLTFMIFLSFAYSFNHSRNSHVSVLNLKKSVYIE